MASSLGSRLAEASIVLTARLEFLGNKKPPGPRAQEVLASAVVRSPSGKQEDGRAMLHNSVHAENPRRGRVRRQATIPRRGCLTTHSTKAVPSGDGASDNGMTILSDAFGRTIAVARVTVRSVAPTARTPAPGAQSKESICGCSDPAPRYFAACLQRPDSPMSPAPPLRLPGTPRRSPFTAAW